MSISFGGAKFADFVYIYMQTDTQSFHNSPILSLWQTSTDYSKIFYHICVCLLECISQIASFSLCYLEVSIDEVKDKDSSHTDEELCGGAEAAQVDSQNPQLLHRLYVGWHDLRGRRDGDWNVLPWTVVAHQAIFGTHCICGFWELWERNEGIKK